jgi:hypothetical protein
MSHPGERPGPKSGTVSYGVATLYRRPASPKNLMTLSPPAAPRGMLRILPAVALRTEEDEYRGLLEPVWEGPAQGAGQSVPPEVLLSNRSLLEFLGIRSLLAPDWAKATEPGYGLILSMLIILD